MEKTSKKLTEVNKKVSDKTTMKVTTGKPHKKVKFNSKKKDSTKVASVPVRRPPAIDNETLSQTFKHKNKNSIKVESVFTNNKPNFELIDDNLFEDEQMPVKPSRSASNIDLVVKYSKLTTIYDCEPKRCTVSWGELIENLSELVIRGSMSLKEHLDCNKDPELKQKSDVQRKSAAIIPGYFKRKKRPPITKMSIELGGDYSDKSCEYREVKGINEKCLRRTLLVAELDEGRYDFKGLTEKLKSLKLECFVHTSFLHSNARSMFTVYFPFDKEIFKDADVTCSRALSWLESKLGTNINPICWRVSQGYCMPPACPPQCESKFKARHIEGKLLKISNFKIDVIEPKVIQEAGAHAIDHTEEDYNNQADWRELLSPLGLSYSFTDKLGKDIYMGTDKNKNAILGVVYSENNTFYVQKRAKTVGPLITGRCYSPFEAYSLIKHNGDRSAATSALLSEGYGEPEDFNKKDDFTKLSPSKLASKLFPQIEFPLEIFPPHFRQLVVSYAKGNQCSVAFMATSMLTVLSAAVGKSVVMQIKDGWQTPMFIWAVVIDDSGAGKTHPMDSAMKPILRFQARGGVNTPNISDNNLDQVCKIKPRRCYYTQNISIESLIGQFRESPRGTIIYLDEITGLFEGLNQQKNNKSIDFSNLIALFDGKPLFADCKAGPIDCRESGAAIIGGIQTARYYEAFDKKLQENGIAYRFLTLPFNLEPQNFTDDSITKELDDQWTGILTWMYNIPLAIDPETGCIISEALTAEKDGKELFQTFYNDFMRLKDFMPKEFGGYLPKLITYCLKFSGLVHLLNCYPNYEEISQPVKKSIIEGAIQLAYYYAGQALKLTSGKYEAHDQYSDKIKKCLIALRCEFKNNKLLLQRVLVKINEQLPPKLILTTKQLSNLLRYMELVVKPSNGCKTYVFWDEEIILE